MSDESSGRQAFPTSGPTAPLSIEIALPTVSVSSSEGPTDRELRLAFLNRLQGRIDAIEAAWSRFARHREPTDFGPLKVLVHRLAASAETYGLDEVTAMTRDLDRQTHPVVAIKPFTERLAALREAVERATGGDSH
jgi:hypothetical protein